MVKGPLDAIRVRVADSLVNGQRLAQILRSSFRLPVLHVTVADAFERAGLLQRRGDVTRDAPSLEVVDSGLARI